MAACKSLTGKDPELRRQLVSAQWSLLGAGMETSRPRAGSTSSRWAADLTSTSQVGTFFTLHRTDRRWSVKRGQSVDANICILHHT